MTIVLHLTCVSVHEVKVGRKSGNSPGSLTAFEFNLPLSSLLFSVFKLQDFWMSFSYIICNVPNTTVKWPLVFLVINKIYNNMSLNIICRHKSLNYARRLGSWKLFFFWKKHFISAQNKSSISFRFVTFLSVSELHSKKDKDEEMLSDNCFSDTSRQCHQFSWKDI